MEVVSLPLAQSAPPPRQGARKDPDMNINEQISSALRVHVRVDPALLGT